ncbi:MAG: hypothetical protein JWR38_1330 [Mucilaginibacter sp.]|nr:hypothetical protein [Mucilaginibacter sp.]
MSLKYYSALGLLCLLIFQSCKKNGPDKPTTDHQDGDVSQLYFNKPNGVNIIVLGDGFIKDDLKKGGAYDTHVKEVIDYLFTIAPFKQYKAYFNTYVVYAESKQRGANKTYDPANTNTKFNASFSDGDYGLLQVGNYDTFYEYVNKAVPKDKAHLTVLIVNDDSIDASTGGEVALITTSKLAKYTFVHEVGHTFAGLGDEYVVPEIADNYSLGLIPYIPNLDTTSDPKKVKWSHFLNNDAYRGIVGTFEGGYYRAKGVYRPEESSVMLDPIASLNYNAPSREAIVRKIDEIIGTPFNFDTFLRDDIPTIHPLSVKVNGNTHPLVNDFIGIKNKAQLMKK